MIAYFFKAETFKLIKNNTDFLITFSDSNMQSLH